MKLSSCHAIGSEVVRRRATPQPVFARYKLLEIERSGFICPLLDLSIARDIPMPWGLDGVPGASLERLGDTAVFGDTPEFPRGGPMTPTDCIGDFGHVDVTVGVHRNAVGRNELPGTFALFVRAKATHHLAFQ